MSISDFYVEDFKRVLERYGPLANSNGWGNEFGVSKTPGRIIPSYEQGVEVSLLSPVLRYVPMRAIFSRSLVVYR